MTTYIDHVYMHVQYTSSSKKQGENTVKLSLSLCVGMGRRTYQVLRMSIFYESHCMYMYMHTVTNLPLCTHVLYN